MPAALTSSSRIRFDGDIASWNDERGFGFIAPAQGGEEIFLHVKAMAPRSPRPQVGLKVTFGLDTGPGGRKRAVDVRLQVLRVPRGVRASRREPPARWGPAVTLALPAFAVVWVAAALVGDVPLWVAGLYAAASVASFLAYGFDKAAARAGTRRTTERTLLVLGLIGGWPGGLLAQQWMRHKTGKATFRTQFWITVGINVAAFIALSLAGPGWRLPM